MAGPTLFRPSNISTGLVGYWPLNEPSGTRNDSSANGNHLTDNNTVASAAQDYWRSGANSADFESGNSESLSRTNASQIGLGITSTYSFASFVKFESVVDGMTIVGKWLSNSGYQIRVRSGGHLEVVHNSTLYSSSSGIPVGKWVHIAVVYNATSDLISFYVDGNLIYVVAATTDPTSNSTEFRLGVSGATTDYFDGLMNDAAIWNVAITPIQIKSLALGVDLSTLAYRPNSVSVQPTAWWKLNELSGTRNDSIGSLHLTDNNTVSALGGYVEGVGADFEAGNSEYLSSADNTAFDFSGGIFSVSAWIKAESLAADVPFYCNLTDASNFIRIGTLATGALECVVFSGGGAVVNVTTASGIVKTGTWHHVVVTESGDTWKIYLDGVDVTSGGGTDTSRAANYTGQLEICRRADGAAFWDGGISDLAIWKGYALTHAEIKSLACGIPIQQTGIVSYWKLDETSGNRADIIGVNNLTDNNTVLSGTGKVSNAADFEASNSEYLSIADASQSGLDVTDLTMLCWYKPESTGITSALFDKDGYGSGYGMLIQSTNKLNMTIANNFVDTVNTSLSAGTFYHCVGVYDGADKRVYLNSAKDGNEATTTVIADTAAVFYLGRDASGDYADGLMDEALLAKRWFRDEEIKTIYCKGLAGKELTSEEISASGGINSCGRRSFRGTIRGVIR